MYRSPWEVAALVHYHATDLANERRTCAPLRLDKGEMPSLLARLRRRLGIELIALGWALADDDATPRFSPRARTPAWGVRS
jgi:hypothetical protein